jgi:hypothetical protein
MDDLVQQPELECLNCRQTFIAGRVGQCPTCVEPLVYRASEDPLAPAAGVVYQLDSPSEFLRWFSHANRLNILWIAASLLYAACHLVMLQGVSPFWISAFLVPPILAFAVLGARQSSAKARRLAWVYLAAIVIGDVLAPLPQLLPRMNLFDQLPLAESRLLTWQLALNSVYLFLVLPPAYLNGQLRGAVQRRRVGVGVFAVLFGYSVWIVLLPGILLAVILGFGLL